MKRLLVSGAAIAMAFSGATNASARSLFEDFAATFFGAPSRPTAYYYVPEPEYAPLEMTVRKRKPKKPKPVTWPDVSSKPPPPLVKLDPSTDKNWYLKDPTLKLGDIVVTTRGVLVYNGHRSQDIRRTDFASLGGKSGGKSWQRELLTAAAAGRTYFTDDVAPPTNVQAIAQQLERHEAYSKSLPIHDYSLLKIHLLIFGDATPSQQLGMDESNPPSAQIRLWQSMVRLSAGALVREFGPLAYQKALCRADQEVEINERAFRFWRDVADEIAQRPPSR